MKKTLICAISIACTFIACKKEDAKTATPATVTGIEKTKQQLIATTWKMDSVIYTDNGKVSKAAGPEACEADDTFRYFANGDLVMNHGTIQCDPDEPATATLKFEVRSNGDSLRMMNSAVTIDYKIVSLTASRVELNNTAGTETETMIFKK